MRTAALCPARRSGYNPAGATDPFLAPQDRPIPPTRILVIKLSALGNVVLSLGPFAAIRRHHPDAEITLLTTPPYAAFLAGSPYFDRIWSDGRPRWWDLPALARLRRQLIGAGFARASRAAFSFCASFSAFSRLSRSARSTRNSWRARAASAALFSRSRAQISPLAQVPDWMMNAFFPDGPAKLLRRIVAQAKGVLVP